MSIFGVADGAEGFSLGVVDCWSAEGDVLVFEEADGLLLGEGTSELVAETEGDAVPAEPLGDASLPDFGVVPQAASRAPIKAAVVMMEMNLVRKLFDAVILMLSSLAGWAKCLITNIRFPKTKVAPKAQ
jgi:hypothetical protein